MLSAGEYYYIYQCKLAFEIRQSAYDIYRQILKTGVGVILGLFLLMVMGLSN